MKHKGSVCDFAEERDRELRLLYKRKLMEIRWKRVDEVFDAMAESPASRFYVSEQRALTVVRHRLRTGEFPVMQAGRLEMFREIWRRYEAARAVDKESSDMDIVFDIVNSPAPSFYLTRRSMRTIVYRARQRA